MLYEGKLPERIAWLILWKIPVAILGILTCGVMIYMIYISGGVWLVVGFIALLAWAVALITLLSRMLRRMSGDLKDD